MPPESTGNEDGTGQFQVHSSPADQPFTPEQGEYIRALMESMPTPVFYRDTKGIYRDCNKAFETLVGRPRSRILGRCIHDFFPAEQADHYQYMDNLIIRQPHLQQYEYVITNAVGEKRNVFFSKTGLMGADGRVQGILGVIVDLSLRKKLERIIVESEEKYRTIAESTYDWETWIDSQDRYIYVSSSCERICGYPAEEFTSRPSLVVEMVHHEDREMVAAHYRNLSAHRDEVHHMDYRIVTRNGETRWISHFCQPVFSEDGTWLGRRENKRDISFRKEMEAAYMQVNVKLSLLSSITRHDVLNQLTILSGLADMVQDDIPVGMGQNLLTRMQDTIGTIAKQISFTGEYQEIGLKTPVWQHLPTVIGKACAGIGIPVIRIGDALSEIEVRADPLLEKVFFCFLDNSERHGGGVHQAWFTAQEVEGTLVLTYWDDGIGIPDQEKERIFSRGYGRNTGYGLFLSREILGISGFAIREVGVAGRGVCFEITIPEPNWRQTGETRTTIPHQDE